MDDRFSPSQSSNGSIRDRDRVLPFNHHPVSSQTPLPTTPVAAVGDKTSMKNNDCDKEGVSVSQTITKPFDICTPKQGGSIPRLKPPLFKGNREKRKEQNQIGKGDQLRPGMIHLKGYISLTDQVKIVKVCRELGLGEGGFYQPSYEGGAMLKLKMMCLGRNWDPQTSKYEYQRPCDGSVPPKIPDEFLTLVGSAIKDSHSLAKHPNSKLPLISPDICIVNYYAKNGQLGLHQDKDESEQSIDEGLPVVSFSIGDTAEFLYGDERDVDKAKKVLLESGDVLVFGGKARNVFHGVSTIQPETAPSRLLEETNLRKPGRLNLTFRQY